MFFLEREKLWSCRVFGCTGKGNSNCRKPDHVVARDCPYEFDSWKKTVDRSLKMPDRLKTNEVQKTSTNPRYSIVLKIIVTIIVLFIYIIECVGIQNCGNMEVKKK